MSGETEGPPPCCLFCGNGEAAHSLTGECMYMGRPRWLPSTAAAFRELLRSDTRFQAAFTLGQKSGVEAETARHDEEERHLLHDLSEARRELARVTAELDRIYDGIGKLRVRT